MAEFNISNVVVSVNGVDVVGAYNEDKGAAAQFGAQALAIKGLVKENAKMRQLLQEVLEKKAYRWHPVDELKREILDVMKG